MRVARVERAASFAVEGGSLIPSLGGRVFVRVVTVDGQPAAAGVAVELTGPRVGTLGATTDASGIAVFDVTLHDPPAASRRRARRAAPDDGEEEEVPREVQQMEPAKVQKKLKQTTLFSKENPITEEDKAKKTLKRKKEESRELKSRIKVIKKRKIAEKSTGNLGFVNKYLIDQLEKNSKSEKEKNARILKAQEMLIDHLMDIYKSFWKSHIDKIIASGIKESTLKIFNRRPAVT